VLPQGQTHGSILDDLSAMSSCALK
jgi:hypothetical protein